MGGVSRDAIIGAGDKNGSGYGNGYCDDTGCTNGCGSEDCKGRGYGVSSGQGKLDGSDGGKGFCFSNLRGVLVGAGYRDGSGSCCAIGEYGDFGCGSGDVEGFLDGFGCG